MVGKVWRYVHSFSVTDRQTDGFANTASRCPRIACWRAMGINENQAEN